MGIIMYDDVPYGANNPDFLAPTPFIYSEDEEQVGIWIDGKPLYQKTVSCGALPNAGTKQVSHGVSNIDTITRVFGFANGGSGCMPIPYSTNSTSANIGVNITADNANINLFTGSDRSNIINTYVTIQYTKTTDTAWQGGFKAYGFSPVIYSDTEREIGVWRDGKPLYQKTISGTTITGGQTTNVAHNIASIDEIINSEIIAHFSDNNYWRTLNFAYNNGTTRDDWLGGYAIDATNIYFQIGTAFSATLDKWYANVLYTKTTDTAGSGKYTTLGTPAVHYSSDEQIIGTWVDGKTLYRRTITDLSIALNGNQWVGYSDINYIDKLVDLHTYSNVNGFFMSNCIAEYYYYPTNHTIYLCTVSSTFNRTINVMTIEYTKTS